ncbi:MULTISPECIES: type II toxin-antitoxin system VapB family antitoxin [Pseudomonas]|uniref:type II toxin-antitoxin system VapB family antitoxin n=1 Tax=Pseudomonas TaxID=286 RepID=UPI000BA3D1F9|nr:type II toxin-antitoxin system VapB family antitoxin [Pseudomonas sp. Irchel s3h14]
MEKTTLLISNGSQIIYLPKAVVMPNNVKQVDVVSIGRSRIITPAGEDWDNWFDGDDVSDDFMTNREQP